MPVKSVFSAFCKYTVHNLSIYAREERSAEHEGVGPGDLGLRSLTPTQSTSPFWAGVQFSLDSVRACLITFD